MNYILNNIESEMFLKVVCHSAVVPKDRFDRKDL